jgi:hypothetical protein
VMITRTVAVRKMSNMAFAVGFFFLHWGNIWIGDSHTDLFLKRCIIIWGKQTLMLHGDGRCAVCRIRRMCWKPTNQHLSVQNAVWHTLHENQLCPCHVQPVQRLQPGINISVSSSCSGCCTKLWTPLAYCAIYCGLIRQYLQEMCTLHATCMYGQWRILMLLITPHSNKDLVSMSGPKS